MKKYLVFLFVLLSLSGIAAEHTLHVLSTGDVHGTWFTDPYVQGVKKRPSLMSVKYAVDSVRCAFGKENVILIDAGDFLQGDNAAYYYNYVAKDEPHLMPRMAAYMGYDVMVVGNHDIETGHGVYDRVNEELASYNIPYLAANALKPDGTSYFKDYVVLKKAGMKVLVMGFTNANIKSWLSRTYWDGMDFVSIKEMAQSRIDAAIAKEKPQVVIVVVHSGTGKGDGLQIENEGLDLFNSLSGVDLLISAHDHDPVAFNNPGFSMMNGGSRTHEIGHAVINVETKGRKVVGKSVEAKTSKIDLRNSDNVMKERFMPEFEAVKKFTVQPVGDLTSDLRTRDGYTGMSFYVNMLHYVQLKSCGAKVSFASPLTYNKTVKAGQVVYNDMFTIYPFENQLFVLNLTGAEILGMMEHSYNLWITSEPGGHVLKIKNKADVRTEAAKWSFRERPYNFDSCGGLIYTVDVTAPEGKRIRIQSFADGTPFRLDETYPVSMSSYRATGGGGTIVKGAGLSGDQIGERVVVREKELRDILTDFFKKNETVSPEMVGDKSVIGEWRFVPEEVAEPAILNDMKLLFGE